MSKENHLFLITKNQSYKGLILMGRRAPMSTVMNMQLINLAYYSPLSALRENNRHIGGIAVSARIFFMLPGGT